MYAERARSADVVVAYVQMIALCVLNVGNVMNIVPIWVRLWVWNFVRYVIYVMITVVVIVECKMAL